MASSMVGKEPPVRFSNYQVALVIEHRTTGTGYFSYCWEEHVPADLDLIFIEQAINDEL